MIRSGHQSANYDRDQWLAALAIGLAAIGRFTDADLLIGAVGTPSQRVLALAGVSVAHAKAGSPHALRLAHAAADVVEDIPDQGDNRIGRIEAVSAAAHALGRAGAADRAVALATPPQRHTSFRDEDESKAVLAAVVAGLWAHDPAAAAALTDAEERRLRADDSNNCYTALGFLRLLVAVGHRDPERSHRLIDALRREVNSRSFDPWPQNDMLSKMLALVLNCLLVTGSDSAAVSAGVRQRLMVVEAVMQLAEESDVAAASDRLQNGLLAIAYAAFGDIGCALLAVKRLYDTNEHAEALCALAAYLARVQGGPLATCLCGTEPDWLQLVRRLAALVMPPRDPDSRQFARTLLAVALLTNHWHHTLPVLVALEPDALIRARDVVFEHLGIDD